MSRDALRAAIAHGESLLAKLQAEQTEARQRLAALRAELAALEAEGEIPVRLPLSLGTPTPRTSADKVRLFRSLFRGREDIFPTRFVSAKTGKSGYAPACRTEVKARYIVGLTATPQRRDGQHPIMAMQLGPARFVVNPKGQGAQRPFEHRLIVRETRFRTSREKPAIQELYAALATDTERNQLIVNDAIAALEQGRSPILLTERKDHLEYFAAQLSRMVRHVVVLQGGMSAHERREVKRQLAAIPEGEERLVLATGRYIGEGFDDARLDTLFLALPVSWRGTLIQYAGRLHRLHPAKQEVRIYDYVDVQVPMLLRMFQKRLRGYRGLGYARGEGPLGLAELGDDLVVEYDQEVLRSLKQRNDFV